MVSQTTATKAYSNLWVGVGTLRKLLLLTPNLGDPASHGLV
jgi:hypothetical protein